MNWISVKDELPAEDRIVMVYDKHAREFREDALVLRAGPELCWEWARLNKDVTYWAPRPKVPQAPRKKRVKNE